MATPRIGVADSPIGALRALASDLIARARFAARAGLTFGGDRDLYATLGYKREIDLADYRDRFRRNGIAARIVEAKPQATWRGGAELIEDEDPDVSTKFEENWIQLDDRLGIWSSFMRVDVLAGLGRYATLLIGADGELETPLPRLSGVDSILYVTPYSEEDMRVDSFVTDASDPRFGLPLTYKLNRKTDGVITSSLTTLTRIIHWSRVVHVADGALDDRTRGEPRLDRVWNWIDDLEKITGSGSEAFWLRVNQGMQLDMDPSVSITPTELEDLRDQAQEYEHQIRRMLTTRGVEVKTFGSDVSDFSAQIQSLLSLISGATGIPQRILLGSERGELASTQDKENWDTRIQDRRTAYAEPVIVRQFVDRLIEHGALADPVEYEVRWPEMEELNDDQKATVAEKWAGLNDKVGDVVVTAAEIRDRVLRLPRLEEVTDTPPSEDQDAEREEAGTEEAEDQVETPERTTEGRAAVARRPKAPTQAGDRFARSPTRGVAASRVSRRRRWLAQGKR